MKRDLSDTTKAGDPPPKVVSLGSVSSSSLAPAAMVPARVGVKKEQQGRGAILLLEEGSADEQDVDEEEYDDDEDEEDAGEVEHARQDQITDRQIPCHWALSKTVAVAGHMLPEWAPMSSCGEGFLSQ